MRSMTGFASNMQCTDKYDVFMEIKSVNSRYFEFKLRASYLLNEMEMEIRNKIFHALKRGKVDLFIKIVEKSADNYNVVINEELAAKYEKALKSLAESTNISSELAIRDFMNLDGILNLERVGSNKELKNLVLTMVEELVKKMMVMMDEEGKKTQEDLSNSLEIMKKNVAIIEELYPESLKTYKESLIERIDELSKNGYDENRILMEVEIVSSRSAINEELVRLNSHIIQFDNIISGKSGGDAKKMDFIGQEMHREANTIASKSNTYEIIQSTIALKGEIEKIREQLRNIV